MHLSIAKTKWIIQFQNLYFCFCPKNMRCQENIWLNTIDKYAYFSKKKVSSMMYNYRKINILKWDIFSG